MTSKKKCGVFYIKTWTIKIGKISKPCFTDKPFFAAINKIHSIQSIQFIKFIFLNSLMQYLFVVIINYNLTYFSHKYHDR